MSWDYSQCEWRKIHAMESRSPISIFVDDGPHLQTWHGKRKETVTLENNRWHWRALHFHPSLGEKLIQFWCLPFKKTSWNIGAGAGRKPYQTPNPNANDLLIAGNAVQWAPQWTPIPWFSLSEKLKEGFTVVCNSLFFFRKTAAYPRQEAAPRQFQAGNKAHLNCEVD